MYACESCKTKQIHKWETCLINEAPQTCNKSGEQIKRMIGRPF